MNITADNTAGEIGNGVVARSLAVHDLGYIPYEACWQKQRELSASVNARDAPDTLLLLEHEHVYTCGRGGGRDHILADGNELRRLGAAVLDVDRGGDVTYHGPGQLVAYPIINLFENKIGRDYRGYIRALEEVLISLLADFAISSHRLPGFSGAWVHGPTGEEKLAAIGVKVDGRGITSHGIGLNVATDLSYFSKIVPCGIADKGVTSMSVLLRECPPMWEVKEALARHFRRVFGFH